MSMRCLFLGHFSSHLWLDLYTIEYNIFIFIYRFQFSLLKKAWQNQPFAFAFKKSVAKPTFRFRFRFLKKRGKTRLNLSLLKKAWQNKVGFCFGSTFFQKVVYKIDLKQSK
uniref:Uncharacterized protein n=1 Tax=viral metagenome TaxID=1070528 RepID=A0A6C0HFQ1_9ZZZZ